MLDYVRYRWTASDDLTRRKLGIVTMRSSEDVLKLMLESKKNTKEDQPRV